MASTTARATTPPDELEIRAQARRLLDSVPPEKRTGRTWLSAAYDTGLAWVSFPPGLGGLGAPEGMQAVVEDELGRAGCTLREDVRAAVGYGLAAPVLVEFAPELAAQMLPALFCLDEYWCQLFSEPGAGSDVASLATRAVRDGDGWRINGQKVWTTLGHLCKWALLVARTDPSVPKHRGITYFVLDMEQEGVEIRPLRQMTGDAEFNEVFLTDAWVPDSHRLGGVGEGWRVLMATLNNERFMAADVGSTPAGAIDRAIELYAAGDPDVVRAQRDRMLALWVRDRVTQLLMERSDLDGSLAKLAQTAVKQDSLELCVDLMGPAGVLYPSDGYRPAGRDAADHVMEDLRWQFLRSRAATIEGGTSEVMRNILGERVLGLPKEPAVDRDLPWQDLPR